MKLLRTLALALCLVLALSSVPFAMAEERIEISVIGVDWGYGPLANSEMEQYWEDMFDVTLNIEWVNYNDYSEKVNALITAAAQPDVIQVYKTNNTFYYPLFTKAIDAGQFLDLTPYLYEGGLIENNAVFANWDKSMWTQATYNGGIYILPRSKAEVAQQSGINVRRDLMKKYGFEEEPTNMEDLKTWLIELSDAASEGEGYKIYALDFYGDFMTQRVKGFAIAFTGQEDWCINEDGEFQYIQFNPDYINFLDWMKDLYDAEVLDPEFALKNADTSKWKGGKSIAYLTAWYNWNQSADRVSNKIFDKNTSDEFEAWCLLPVQGDKGIVIDTNSTDIDSCIAISSACSEEKVQKILQVFCATEEAYPGYDNLLQNGVEGIHYVLKDDGTIDTSDPVMGQKRTEGYVGAWNQIFLKTDADQITSKFRRSGAKRASDEAIQRAEDIKAVLVDYLAESGLAYANTNLYSETYNTSWSSLITDVDSYCTRYVMGEITADEFKNFINGLVESDDYIAIQAEFKEAAGK